MFSLALVRSGLIWF